MTKMPHPVLTAFNPPLSCNDSGRCLDNVAPVSFEKVECAHLKFT